MGKEMTQMERLAAMDAELFKETGKEDTSKDKRVTDSASKRTMKRPVRQPVAKKAIVDGKVVTVIEKKTPIADRNKSLRDAANTQKKSSIAQKKVKDDEEFEEAMEAVESLNESEKFEVAIELLEEVKVEMDELGETEDMAIVQDALRKFKRTVRLNKTIKDSRKNKKKIKDCLDAALPLNRFKKTDLIVKMFPKKVKDGVDVKKKVKDDANDKQEFIRLAEMEGFKIYKINRIKKDDNEGWRITYAVQYDPTTVSSEKTREFWNEDLVNIPSRL